MVRCEDLGELGPETVKGIEDRLASGFVVQQRYDDLAYGGVVLLVIDLPGTYVVLDDVQERREVSDRFLVVRLVAFVRVALFLHLLIDVVALLLAVDAEHEVRAEALEAPFLRRYLAHNVLPVDHVEDVAVLARVRMVRVGGGAGGLEGVDEQVGLGEGGLSEGVLAPVDGHVDESSGGVRGAASTAVAREEHLDPAFDAVGFDVLLQERDRLVPGDVEAAVHVLGVLSGAYVKVALPLRTVVSGADGDDDQGASVLKLLAGRRHTDGFGGRDGHEVGIGGEIIEAHAEQYGPDLPVGVGHVGVVRGPVVQTGRLLDLQGQVLEGPAENAAAPHEMVVRGVRDAGVAPELPVADEPVIDHLAQLVL